jgi:hypothetical protein
MYEQKIPALATPEIEITSCRGDLAITSGDAAELVVRVEGQELLTVEERDGAVAVVIDGDGQLSVPDGAVLRIVQVHGDLALQAVSASTTVATVRGDLRLDGGMGTLSLDAVQGDMSAKGWIGPFSARTLGGDLRLQQMTGEVHLTAVNGDLAADEINGPLAVESVAGDAYLRQLNGPLSAQSIGADLMGRDWLVGGEVAQVGGDATLKTLFVGPHTTQVKARGSIVATALPGSSATFTLRAAGGVRAKGLDGDTTEEGQWQGSVGEGEAQVTLTASHGSILLKAAGETAPADAALGFEAEMADAEDLAWRIQQRVAEKLSKIDFEAIALREAERARRQAEKEAARAQRAVEKARRRAERSREKASRRRHWHVEWEARPAPPKRPKRSGGVSEEERLAVLKMLAEGQISADEAETLLAALED